MKRILGIVIMSCLMLGLGASVVQAEDYPATDFTYSGGAGLYTTGGIQHMGAAGSAKIDIVVPVEGLYEVSVYYAVGGYTYNVIEVSVGGNNTSSLPSGTDVITHGYTITGSYTPHVWASVGVLHMHAGPTVLRVSSAGFPHVATVKVDLITPVEWPFLDAEAGDFTCADGAYIETSLTPDAIVSGATGGTAEADISIPLDGFYEFSLLMGNHYGSPVRPIDISIGGVEVIGDFQGGIADGWNPDVWCVAGEVFISAGDTVLTLSSDAVLPHVGAVSLRRVSVSPQAPVVLQAADFDVPVGYSIGLNGPYLEPYWNPATITSAGAIPGGSANADFSVSTAGFYEISAYMATYIYPTYGPHPIDISINNVEVISDFTVESTGGGIYAPIFGSFIAGVVYIPAGDNVLTLSTPLSDPFPYQGVASVSLSLVIPEAEVVLDAGAGDFDIPVGYYPGLNGPYVETGFDPNFIFSAGDPPGGSANADISVPTTGFYEISAYMATWWDEHKVDISINGGVVISDFMGDCTGTLYPPDTWFVAGVVYIPAGDNVLTLYSDTFPPVATVSLGLVALDIVAPEVTILTHVEELWPPNHKMVDAITYTVTDDADPNPTVTVTVVQSGTVGGDGNTEKDVDLDTLGVVSLRAERSGRGTGRTYEVTIYATDESGNESDDVVVTVTVPHDQGK